MFKIIFLPGFLPGFLSGFWEERGAASRFAALRNKEKALYCFMQPSRFPTKAGWEGMAEKSSFLALK